MALPGAIAPADQQWTTKTQPVNVGIPDNLTPGVDADVGVDAVGGVCSKMLSIQVGIGITHPRVSDLYVTVSAVSRDGSSVLKTLTVFDGPSLARGGTSMSDMVAALNGGFDVSQLTQASDCGRLRVNVADWAPGQAGTIDSITLKVRTAWYAFAHDRTYYTDLLFGPDFPNVNAFYREESRGAFGFSNAGVYGPVPWGNWHVGESDDDHVADIIYWLEALGFDFAAYDANHDNVVDSNELQIVEFENSNDVGGANRGTCATLRRSSLQVCVSAAIVSEQTDFATLTHEISHTLGTVDLYGAWSKECLSQNMTLMSCTISSDDNPATYYHDPWHRSRVLGWYSPYNTGCRAYQMGDESWTDASGNKSMPSIYYNPKNFNEYYLFEYRRPNSYDKSVADTGIVAWHVSENADGSPYQGTDGKQPIGHFIYALSRDQRNGQVKGGSRAWKQSDGDFQLMWLDGTQLPYTFSVTQPGTAPNSAILNCWDPSGFNFSIAPQQTTLAANDSESLTLTTTIGSCSPVQFSVAAAPPGVNASVSSPTVSASGSSYLYLSVNASTAPETGTVTVTGTCGGQTESVSVQLTTTPCVSQTCSSDSCGTISDGCGSSLNCGGCAAGLVCQGGSCQTQTPKCKTPRQCCIQAGGDWINGHCE